MPKTEVCWFYTNKSKKIYPNSWEMMTDVVCFINMFWSPRYPISCHNDYFYFDFTLIYHYSIIL